MPTPRLYIALAPLTPADEGGRAGATRFSYHPGPAMITPAQPPTAPDQRNVLGGPLQSCSRDPMTGFTRSGCCEQHQADTSSHSVCAVMTAAFLAFTRDRGNDLSTPRPEYRFPGLKPGDRWCLCAVRWHEAFLAGVAPPVVLEACHARCLSDVRLVDLQHHAVTENA